MKLLSKIAFFFLYVIITLSFLSCTKDEAINHDTIPYTWINVIADFTSHTNLRTINNPVAIDSYLGKKVGYKGHGIYVIKINQDSYTAFDRTCPNHGDDFSNILYYTTGSFFYHCKECGAKYNFINGYPTKDLNPNNPAGRVIPKLQEYNARQINSYSLRISNNNY